MEKTPKVCIIGAGFSGLCMAIKLKTELNLETFTIFEGCSEVGGTWFMNTYPGCAVDIPSHFYSFSFAPKYDWTYSYSYQPEILEYIKDVTKQYELYPHIRFQTKVETLRWDDRSLKWKATILDVKRQRLEMEEFDIVINGTGKIRIPHYPEEFLNFQGPLIHSAEWDHSVSLKGKRVGIIGTGASAVQIITTIAPTVEHLTVFQRKAPYVAPRAQFQYSKGAKWAFANVPLLYRLSRAAIFWAHEIGFPIVRHDSIINNLGSSLIKWFRGSQIPEPELEQKATPEYTLACKRIILCENYYSTLTQPHVDLVTSKITNLSGNVIRTEDGEDVKLDVLILATGYQPHDYFSPMKVYGKGGVDVLEEWVKYRPKGYLGICSNDMPNFYTLLGPYSALGHSSNLYTIECQVNWTILALKAMLQKDARCLTITKKAENEFMKFMDKEFKGTVWGNAKCGSWYLDKKGENTTLWPLNQITYWRWCNNLNTDLFGFVY